MKAAARRPWTAGGRPGRWRPWCAGRPTDRPGTGEPGPRGRTRGTTWDRGGPRPRGIEGGARADAGMGGRRCAGGPAATPRTPPGTAHWEGFF